MPLFNLRRAYDAARKAEREELQRDGARQLERARDAWDEKKANGGTDEPKPTADSIEYR